MRILWIIRLCNTTTPAFKLRNVFPCFFDYARRSTIGKITEELTYFVTFFWNIAGSEYMITDWADLNFCSLNLFAGKVINELKIIIFAFIDDK